MRRAARLGIPTVVLLALAVGCGAGDDSCWSNGGPQSEDLANQIERSVEFDAAVEESRLLGTLDFDGDYWEISVGSSEGLVEEESVVAARATRLSEGQIRVVLDDGAELTVNGPVTCE